jgi:hypothetical protein
MSIVSATSYTIRNGKAWVRFDNGEVPHLVVGWGDVDCIDIPLADSMFDDLYAIIVQAAEVRERRRWELPPGVPQIVESD